MDLIYSRYTCLNDALVFTISNFIEVSYVIRCTGGSAGVWSKHTEIFTESAAVMLQHRRRTHQTDTITKVYRLWACFDPWKYHDISTFKMNALNLNNVIYIWLKLSELYCKIAFAQCKEL